MKEKKDVITVSKLLSMKATGEKISMLTAYDYSFAKLLDNSGIDIILVGDSAGNVIAGYETTVPVTLEQMLYHATSVKRAVNRSFVVVDLPFGSYQSNVQKGVEAAVRIMKESEVHGVKVEGGVEIKESIEAILSCGIPVMGHLGLTPQSIHQFGSYSVRGKEEMEAEKLVSDALLLEELGCFAIVLEKVPSSLAQKVSHQLTIPVIGIGAGADVDGQVLVLYDLLGITEGFSPKFLRQYDSLSTSIRNAVKNYVKDVKSLDFPNKEESY